MNYNVKTFVQKLESLDWKHMLFYKYAHFVEYKIVYGGNGKYRARKYVHGVCLCCWQFTIENIEKQHHFAPDELNRFEKILFRITYQ